MKTLFIFCSLFITVCYTNCRENSSSPNNNFVIADTAKGEEKQITNSTLPLQVSFPSADGIIISADTYFQNDSFPWILLCHQAGYSRGEYRETAAKFKKLGFNCLAIDQRSGNEVNGVKNETAARAKAQGKPTEYLDAEQDIIAAVNYIFETSKKPIIILGSSYSAGLVLKIAVDNPKIKAILSFSPGEYYGDKLNLSKSISTLDKPVFITSAKTETKAANEIFVSIHSDKKTIFIPMSPGVHASSCLWESTDDYREYWKAVSIFLMRLK